MRNFNLGNVLNTDFREQIQTVRLKVRATIKDAENILRHLDRAYEIATPLMEKRVANKPWSKKRAAGQLKSQKARRAYRKPAPQKGGFSMYVVPLLQEGPKRTGELVDMVSKAVGHKVKYTTLHSSLLGYSRKPEALIQFIEHPSGKGKAWQLKATVPAIQEAGSQAT
jgi:hypothetical protein